MILQEKNIKNRLHFFYSDILVKEGVCIKILLIFVNNIDQWGYKIVSLN